MPFGTPSRSRTSVGVHLAGGRRARNPVGRELVAEDRDVGEVARPVPGHRAPSWTTPRPPTLATPGTASTVALRLGVTRLRGNDFCAVDEKTITSPGWASIGAGRRWRSGRRADRRGTSAETAISVRMIVGGDEAARPSAHLAQRELHRAPRRRWWPRSDRSRAPAAPRTASSAARGRGAATAQTTTAPGLEPQRDRADPLERERCVQRDADAMPRPITIATCTTSDCTSRRAGCPDRPEQRERRSPSGT